MASVGLRAAVLRTRFMPVSASHGAIARRTPSSWSRSPRRSRSRHHRRKTPTGARLRPASTTIRPRFFFCSCTCNRKQPRASPCFPRREQPINTVCVDHVTFATRPHAPKDVFCLVFRAIYSVSVGGRNGDDPCCTQTVPSFFTARLWAAPPATVSTLSSPPTVSGVALDGECTRSPGVHGRRGTHAVRARRVARAVRRAVAHLPEDVVAPHDHAVGRLLDGLP